MECNTVFTVQFTLGIQTMKTKYLLALCAMMLLPSMAANASLVQVYYATGTSGVDAAFENTGGWLQTTYGLPNIILPNGNISPTVLPQLELAIGQLAANNANGLHLPTAASGIPGVAYNNGTGVHTALTNHSPMGNASNGGGSVTGTLTNFNNNGTRSVPFVFSRTGTLVSYQADSKIWTSATQSYYSDLNSLEFRLRSTTGNTETLTNLIYNDAVTASQSLSNITAASGNVTIALFSGVTAGDFNLSGTFNYTGTGNGWNHQIKGLDLPPAVTVAVPEPSSLFLLTIGAAGIAGARRRRKS
jgi:hypothetical protein